MKKSIEGFRLGNYAQFDGELQCITTQVGLDNSAFLEPVAISHKLFQQLGYDIHRQTPIYTMYMFETVLGDGVRVVFNSHHTTFLVFEHISDVEYPFVKWMHQLQNLIEELKKPRLQLGTACERRSIVVK